MGTGFAKKKKQAKMMQEQMSKMASQMQESEAEGQAGNGLVKVVLSGEGELKSIRINPECVDKDDIEGLQDLIKAAHADAQGKIRQQTQQMPGLGGMGGMSGFPDLSALGL